MSDINEHKDGCPICLEDCSEPNDPQQHLVAPPCGHAACRSCFEQMLLVTTSSVIPTPANPQANTTNPTGRESSSVPTLGSCPLCRASVYLFDLVDQESRDIVYPKEPAIPLPPSLRNTVYSEPAYGIGYGSWHFKSGSCNDDDDDEEEDDQIYFDLSQVDRLPGQDAIIPLVMPHFHSRSRTLAGHLPFQSGQYERWNVYLSFSSDYSFIRTGLIHKVRQRIDDDPTLVRKRYPMDGIWHVAGSDDESNIVVVEGMIATTMRHGHGSSSFVLRVDREGNTMDVCSVSGQAIARATFDWTSNPVGPECGDAIIWKKTTDPTATWNVWVRKTAVTTVPPDEYVTIGGNSQRSYRRVNMEPRLPPSYHKDSIWGNTFCQGFKVGLASYHFVSPDDAAGAYISYEHPATGQWPPLDNGAPVPSRVFFHDIHIDGTTFRGRIDWQQDYGTTWQGMAEWDYEMVFDQEFTCIVSGRVLSRGLHEASAETEMSRYGESLVYINAALYPMFRESTSNSSFAATSQALRRRLLDEGVSVRTMAAVHQVLTASQGAGDTNPIDWNL